MEEQKAKFNRKMSKVVEGLGSHAQGTIRVLQRYYEAASSVTDSPSTSVIDDESETKSESGEEPLRAGTPPHRKSAIYNSPFESLSKGEWLQKLAELEAIANPDVAQIKKRFTVVSCVLGALERSGLRHVVLLTLLFVYLLLGGLVISEIEDGKMKERENEILKSRMNMSHEIVNACVSYGFDIPRGPRLWDFGDAVIYCFITITTIGYGDMTCSSRTCKIFTIFYLIFGIPLLLMTLSDMGRFLLRQLQKIIDWSLRRRAQKEGKGRTGDLVVEIELAPAIGVVFVYIFLCAGVFCMLEPSWDYFTALYFRIEVEVFVSLSTIGFGDVVPSTHSDALAACVVLLIGLSLCSLVINVAQRRMELKYIGALKVMEVAYQTSLASARRHSARPGSAHRRGSMKKLKGAVVDGITQNISGFGRLV